MLKLSNSPGSDQTSVSRVQIENLVFLVLWPGINATLIAVIMIDVGRFELDAFLIAATKIWTIFGLSLIALKLVRLLPAPALHQDNFTIQFVLHCAAIVSVGAIVGPIVQPPADANIELSLVAPRVFLMLEIAVYLGVLRLLTDQERMYSEQAARREAELGLMRSQSNPHFLFNTLNLITSEISHAPERAKEIVFDLSDLLRESLSIARSESSTVNQEFSLVTLYLQLQQKRFEDRLTYEVNVADEAECIEVPPLLLQPIVENTIKHAVAPHAKKTHITATASVEGDALVIEFRDSGPAFDDSQINEGNGFRILRGTLDLRYGKNHLCTLRSTEDGGAMTLRLPITH